MSINYRLSAGEIDYMLENSGAAALFVGRGGIEVAASLAQHPLLKRRVCIAGELPGYENYEQVLASARSTLPPSQPRGGRHALLFGERPDVPKASSSRCRSAMSPIRRHNGGDVLRPTSALTRTRATLPQRRFVARRR